MNDFETKKYNIICLSNQLWDFPNWTNKKHVMTRLARMGHSVLFVDPPINTGRVFARQVLRGLWGIGRIFTQKKKDATGALVYTPLSVIPFTKFTSKLHIKKIQSLARKFFDPDNKTVLWVYHVEIANLEKYVDDLSYDLLVYDCVDRYDSFPRYDTSEKKEWIINQEKLLAERANVVFATTPLLVEKLKEFNLNVFFAPNVGDYEKFKDAKAHKEQLPRDLENIPRPRIGFAGALDEYKFDARLVEKVARDYPNYSFVLIGQVALKDRSVSFREFDLSKAKNVYLLGTRPYEILEQYYAGFDVYIIPYQLSDYTVGGCFPVKFHDALAVGLPTVVTDLPAYAPFKDVCYISKNYNEFSENIKKALEEDSESRTKARQQVAKVNNWDTKVQKMLGYIAQTLPGT